MATSNDDSNDTCCAASDQTIKQHQDQVQRQREALEVAKEIGAIEALAKLDITPENSDLAGAMADCLERNLMYRALEDAAAEKLRQQGKEPYPCYNIVCPQQKQSSDGKRYNWCITKRSHGCLFCMMDTPPNLLNYSDYMPSHREALGMLEKHELLRGDRQRYLEAAADWGKPPTQKARADFEVKGVTMAQVEACMQRTLEEHASSNYIRQCDGEEFCDCLSSNAKLLATNFGCNLEKVMGVYPNIQLLR